MPLTEDTALRAYAKMINTLSINALEPLLADDFTYESQMVFGALESKQVFLDYMRPKLQTIQQSNATVYAEGDLFLPMCYRYVILARYG